MHARRPTGCAWVSQFLIPKSKRVELPSVTAHRGLRCVGPSPAQALGKVIDCTLREDARRTAAAVMGMWDAYRSIQAKVVGQERWNSGTA